METIEIRRSKSKSIPILALLSISLISITYYIFLSGEFDDNNTIKILFVFLIPLMLYVIYVQTKKLFANEPVLIFSKSGIEINKKDGTISFLWLQVVDWKIKKDNDAYYLIIEQQETKHIINISWLDKKPGEIENLLQTYKAR